jgi:hypothetical protein
MLNQSISAPLHFHVGRLDAFALSPRERQPSVSSSLRAAERDLRVLRSQLVQQAHDPVASASVFSQGRMPQSVSAAWLLSCEVMRWCLLLPAVFASGCVT